MIKVYTTESCPWCTKAKTYLKTKGIVFQELNIEKDEKARDEMVQKSNQKGVPVLDIDGSIIIGFNKPAIDEAINL
ncbi:NrdH-redoxin [Clostridium sporogenes]|jgi:glutaredoxin-like YruB-family protein|uniref:NrdH-redoxin n=2 Tax=Clostridium TaxID=1485 RepID=A0AAE5C9S3_CLOSG|nr:MULTISPECIES: glutaredoxin domain-containing protein [Clostridium]EKS4344410.1 glutathione S-transferase N-terminal domain-containing protein [Clostridium botulinum]MBE6076592.1 NrdH-redoxin [Clostridium lundense]EDU37556.1 glutaredoxin [Clostridium sporogenes ATCC 15579]EKS4394288.1 glutathione S-transferase N-terminal domain-containing protein [Clostridium botulinum]KIS23245.1 glutaredoxin [Clostridium botulinum B2 450]